MRVALPSIRHNLRGYQDLSNLHSQTRSCLFDKIVIDMSSTTWFDADMCAPIGALLYRLGAEGNTITLSGIPSGIERVLTKNGFLSSYGRERIPGTWGTTIPYMRFETKDDRFFANYIEEKFVHRSEMPRMSAALLKRFRESVFEIFSNAVIHSRTKLGIFSCGQYFPAHHRLDFTVADLGIGICKRVQQETGQNFAAEEAIDWATSGRNTTKSGKIPGGLGLKILKEFVDLNGGSLTIVSDAGFWRRTKGNTIVRGLSHPFPGTIVTLDIDTSDTNSYMLSSELTEADIF